MSYLSNLMSEDDFSYLMHGKVQNMKNEEPPKFRDSSTQKVERKPCPCMKKQVKETPSS
jgi:hypothetical protein